MASPTDQRAPAPANYEDYLPDDLADLFGPASGGEEPSAPARPRTDGTEKLGIDEEVAVTKRVREPRVKLDESRLLSAKGIPALRQRARVLKLKGKGHEFSDTARLLSLYQLWLDDLFPKARFADALAMVEKEGHKASMHKMRMEWINETKPGDQRDADADWDWTQPVEGLPDLGGGSGGGEGDGDAPADVAVDDHPPADVAMDDGPLPPLPSSSSAPPPPTGPGLQHRPLPVADGPPPGAPAAPDDPDDDVPDDDVLEALMAEAAAA